MSTWISYTVTIAADLAKFMTAEPVIWLVACGLVVFAVSLVKRLISGV